MFRLGKELEVRQYCLWQKSMKAIDVFQQLRRPDIFENESLIKSEISGKPLLLYI